MMVLLTALFERAEEVERAHETLNQADFECIEVTEVTDGEASVERLVRLGVDEDNARYVLEAIEQGQGLLAVSCSEGRDEELIEILEDFDVAQISIAQHWRGSSPAEEKLAGGSAADAIREDRLSDDTLREKFQQADSERMIGEREARAEGLSRREHGLPEDEQRVDPMERLRQFMPAFEDHYEKNFADSSRDFDEFARGYRYGMALAEHGGFRDFGWDRVEKFARRGWETQSRVGWEEFREAVRFGWEVIRGDEETERRPGY